MACGVDGNRSITPLAASSSAKSKLSPPIWQTELHTELWGKRQFFDDTFRTVTLTKVDFIGLQQQLHSHDPERNSDSYVAQDVLAIKTDVLRSRSSADSTSLAFHFDAAPNDNLVPKLVFNTTHDDLPIRSDIGEGDEDDAVDATSSDAAAVHANAMDVVSDPDSYIDEDAIYLSTGDTAIFPCTVRYVDKGAFELTHFTRIPELILFRNEWGYMVDIFNKRKKGIRGVSLQVNPAFGECCYCFESYFPTDGLIFKKAKPVYCTIF